MQVDAKLSRFMERMLRKSHFDENTNMALENLSPGTQTQETSMQICEEDHFRVCD